MNLDGPYEPSPWEPISEQVSLYESSGGVEGAELEGKPCIILWTVGAKTGAVRKTPLMRVTDGTNYVVIGSMGGAPTNPNWVHNLRANPVARLQDGATINDYTVHQAEGDEKTAYWKLALETWPSYDDYQASTDRVIPLFVLTPTGG